MSQQQISVRDDLWWAGSELHARLQSDPAAVLKERGINFPIGVSPESLRDVARMVSLLWLNGNIVTRDQFRIDPFDHGLLFGRGAWESTLAIDGVPWLWPSHLDRLRHTAALLGIDISPDRLPSSEQVTSFVRTLTSMRTVLRLNVTAGPPGKPGIVWMTASLPELPKPAVRLKTFQSQVDKGLPFLTWKTFQYFTRFQIGQQAHEAGFDTALVLDKAGNLLEAAHANIFLRLRQGWATPIADGGLLPGTVRQFLLEKSPLPVREQTIPQAVLGEVTEAFLTNSNVGIVPVSQIDQHVFPVGSETQSLIRWLQV